jgi:uncharacterized protein RhaS with RHS repeats
MGNRFYDTATGRFISPDPARSGTNGYAYCGNNPVNQVDPLGLDPPDSFTPIGGGNGGLLGGGNGGAFSGSYFRDWTLGGLGSVGLDYLKGQVQAGGRFLSDWRTQIFLQLALAAATDGASIAVEAAVVGGASKLAAGGSETAAAVSATAQRGKSVVLGTTGLPGAAWERNPLLNAFNSLVPQRLPKAGYSLWELGLFP